MNKGIFVREEKNRFLCTINVNGNNELCYVASSCKIENFMQLRNREVILTEISDKHAKTKFSLLGVRFKQSYILLNSYYANLAIEKSIMKRRFSFLGSRKEIRREYNVSGYKSDFFIPATKTIIEVKSIISEEKDPCFGTVYSERFIRQLDQIEKCLEIGYSAYIFIVALNPYVNKIILLYEQPYFEKLDNCMQKGLRIYGFRCRLNSDGTPEIVANVPIEIR